MSCAPVAYGGLADVRAGVDFYETAHWLTLRAARRGAARTQARPRTPFKRPSLDGGVLRGREIFSRGFVQAIIAAFCAPLPAPLPMVALVSYLIRIEETRLHFYDCSESRGDEGNSQRQFAC